MLKSNTLNKIIAVVIAVTLWAYVITVENPPESQVIRDVPVTFTSLDMLASKGLTISGEASYTIDVVIEGKRSDVYQVTRDEIEATVDLLGFPRGEHSLRVEVTAPETVTVTDRRPSNITVNIEELINVNKPIRVEFTESFRSGTEPGFLTMIPEEIEVSGAKSEVDDISYIRAELESSQLSTSLKTFVAEAIPINSRGEPVYSLMLSQPEIEVSARLCTVKEVPLNVNIIGEVSPLYEVTALVVPETVKIRGSRGAVDAVSAVTAADINISDVDVTSKLPLSLRLPEGIELAGESAGISASIAIKGIATKEFEIASNDIQIEAIPQGYSAHVNTGMVNVAVFGSDNIISGFTAGDIALFVDLSGVAPGAESADVPVQVRYDKSLARVVLSPETVHVILMEDSLATTPAQERSQPPAETGGNAAGAGESQE